mgnify:CR=1 FL=1
MWVGGFKKFFDKIIEIDNNIKFSIEDPQSNKFWKDVFYSLNNNTKNFKYKNINQLKWLPRKIVLQMIKIQINSQSLLQVL